MNQKQVAALFRWHPADDNTVPGIESIAIMNDHPGNRPPVVTGIRKFAYLFLALVFFVLGMIGVALPGIPTTPFLLLMSFFLLRSSPQLHRRVLNWPIVGQPLSDWHRHRGVRPRVKITAYVMVAILVGLSLVLGQLNWTVKIVVASAALLGVTIVYRLPTIDEPRKEPPT